MEQCQSHIILDGKIDSIAASMAAISANLETMAATMAKLEDNNIQLVALREEVKALTKAFDKSEKEHDEIFVRLKDIEAVGCHPRLKKLEETQTKCPQVVALTKQVDKIDKDKTWLVRLVIGAFILGFIGLGFHAVRPPIGYTKYTIPAATGAPSPPAVKEKW